MTINPHALFAIIPVSTPGSAPADAIMVGGPLSAVLENVPDSVARNNSIRAHQAARINSMATEQKQKAIRALQIAAFADSINQISARLDAVEKRRTQRARHIAAQQKADEEKQIQDYLNTLPDPDNPDDPDAAVIQSPSGELHALPPTNTGDDAEGDLPKQLLRTTPPSPGTYPLDDPAEMDVPSQPKFRAPVAVSLNEADDYDY